jgi:hypothetical protein
MGCPATSRAKRKELHMKKQAIELHKIYAVKIGSAVVPVRLESENPHGGWNGTSMTSKKSVRIRSSRRLRGLWPKKTMPIVADEAAGAADVGPKGEPAAKAAKDATAAAGGDTDKRGAKKNKAPKEPKPERHSLLNLAAKILAESAEPLNCQQMVEKVLATGLWQTKGRTPAATLYSAILRQIQTKGEQARFRKVERGKFAAIAE